MCIRDRTWNGSSWTEVNDLNTGRNELAGHGIVTSALAYGGNLPGATAVTESYNGTNWTEVSDLNQARKTPGGSGTDNTVGIAFGGNIPPDTGKTETWDGSSWTEDGDLSTARNAMASSKGVGSTSALASGGIHLVQLQQQQKNGQVQVHQLVLGLQVEV